jgi:hypothetical protein
MWLRPHVRHVLSDPQSCATFFRAREGQPIRLLLEPAAFLTGSMLSMAEDHLQRAFDALAGMAATAAILLTNVERVDGDDDRLLRVPVHLGALDPILLIRPWRTWREIPVVLLDEEFDAQRALLAP